ncbi:MAG: hypothetical protein LBR19_08900 [Bifidobacteriaceae bacterium]|nr:hypothetical protein [Bifidobacteriaceae bacterium]
MKVKARETQAGLMRQYRESPLPKLDLGPGPWLPGWLFRVAAPAWTAAAYLFGFALGWAAWPVADSPMVFWPLMAVWGAAHTLLVALAPGRGPSLSTPSRELPLGLLTLAATPPLAIGVVALGLPQALWLVLVEYVLWRLVWWAARCGLATWVHWRAFARVALRDLTVLAVTAALGLAAWALELAKGPDGTALQGLGLLAMTAGGVALVALGWASRRLVHRDR